MTDELMAFVDKVERRYNDAFIYSTIQVERSVVQGSELTGAPGQPIDTGLLVGSFIPEFTSRYTWELMTAVDYADDVEENLRGAKFHNHGPHSVALTIAGWQRIVQSVIAE